MAVSQIIIDKAGNLENNRYWRARMSSMKPIGYEYVKGEARRYYTDGRGGYYYRKVTESEMHRRE